MNYFDASQVFSNSTLKNLLVGRNPNRLIRLAEYFIDLGYEELTTKRVFNLTFRELNKHYRNEFFYKTKLFNQKVIGEHNLQTTIAMRELPIGQSIADFVMINGKAEVFEIKTELDNLERLGKQLADYYKAFKYVSVLTNEKMLDDVEKNVHNADVGIYLMMKNGRIREVRPAISNTDYLDNQVLFSLLRKAEVLQYLKMVGEESPDATLTSFFRVSREIFMKKSTEENQILVESILKSTRGNSDITTTIVKKLPQELRYIAYASGLTKRDVETLIKQINQGELMHGRLLSSAKGKAK